MRNYFIHNGQNEIGPLQFEELIKQHLKSDTPIWYEGLENWTTAFEVEELKYLFISRPTPPPLKSFAETPNPTPPKIETKSYSKPLETVIPRTQKNSNVIALSILGGVIVLGLIIWSVSKNNNQQVKTNEGTNTATQQAEQVTQQENQQNEIDKQKQLEDQAKQDEKDRINAKLTEKYMGYRNNWRNFITATNNAYTYDEMGGISNLEVEVYNQTDKKIDEVQVRVDYIKANGGVFKSETVSAYNIGPNGAKSVSAPSSERGTSVKIEIISISASSFHFCYPYGMSDNKNLDPYFCK